MSLRVCLAPANTVAYPRGGGQLWVYLQWALGLRALGCDVVWLEVIDPTEAPEVSARKIATLRSRLADFGFGGCLALTSRSGGPLPAELTSGVLTLEDATACDLLVNLWHSLPATVVNRFRRSAFIDTDPGLLQIWVTTGYVRLARHHNYFSIGETVGAAHAPFPDCGLHWQHTPPPVFLPEWPVCAADAAAPYTTVAHWWGGTFEFDGSVFSNEKRSSFFDFLELPGLTSARLELALCLAGYQDEYRRLMEPRGWTLRDAWEVASTPQDYRRYIQGSRGEFSCAKPAYVRLQSAWVSDRTLCYLASGKPAIVQYTGPSRLLPDGEGMFRFRTLEQAARALAAAEADYDIHARMARALVEEHFDATRVVKAMLERALDGVHV